ncbi:MAG: hypothetical protein ABSH56_35810 [Bryobacteraceae bacterium]|jgi:hypothetical protein
MSHYTLAIISIVGSSLDVLGALYLAYDLLGGEHGPLRALTRGVTYGVIFALGYGIPLGPVFGIACGVTHGLTLALEFSRASRGEPDPGFWLDAAASAVRGLGHGVGAAWYFGPWFGAIFGLASTLGQIAAYRIGIRPSLDYSAAPRPRATRRQILAALNRTLGYGIVAAVMCATLAHHPERAISFGLTIGLAMGITTAISTSCTPVIEWAADHVPEKRMGVYGVVLILIGFALQSTQYWTTLLDIPIR